MKTKLRLTTVALGLAVFNFSALVAQAQFTYIANNGTITITGYTGPDGAVTIPGAINGWTVTSIGDWAFYSYGGLTSVTVPNSVTNIGFRAFDSCSGLTNVTFGNGVTSIGSYAFNSCSSLTNVTLPDSVTSISEYSFGVCASLASVTIGKGVSSIDASAFVGCAALTAINVSSLNPTYSSVAGVVFNTSRTTLVQCPKGYAGGYTIPNSVTNVGSLAFEHCVNLTDVTIGDSVTSIGNGAFASCTSLTSVTLPDSITSILEYSFGGCASLPSVTIPNSVTSIGNGAFAFCTSLTNLTIGKGVSSVGDSLPNGDSTFAGCTRLISITVDPLNAVYSSVDGVLFDKSQTRLMQYPYGKAGSYTIPSSVLTIKNTAFWNCTGLASLALLDNFNNVGVATFWNCVGLTNVTIGDGVRSIDAWTFNTCTGLRNVTIGNGLTRIGEYAFYNCNSLTGVYFKGDAPTSIGYAAFGDPLDPVTVYYLPGTTGWGPTFGDRPTALWVLRNPLILDGSVGVQTNGFGFTISWATNASVVVEATTNLTSPTWVPLQTNALSLGWTTFRDANWMSYPGRFYRVRAQ